MTLDADDVTAEELAKVYGRNKTFESSLTRLDPKACGDVGPVLRMALQLSIKLAEGSGRKLDLSKIECETSPVAANSEIELFACTEARSAKNETIVVTGWLRGRDVLRFRALFRRIE